MYGWCRLKEKRAYNCVLFQTHYDYFICIPYRTEIVHKFSYRFKNSKRSKKHKSGLDYTKIIIVKNKEYIDAENAIIDRDEFKETNINIERIKKEALLYVEEYIYGLNDKNFMNKKENVRKYGYSTLKYFHNELGIAKYTEE